MSPETTNNDEIDIRPILNTLWKKKWWIIAATLILGILALLGSKFLLTETYEAKAYVVFTKPSTTVNFDPSIQSSPQLPDAKSLSDLMLADDLVNAVRQDPEVSALYLDPLQPDDFRGMLKQALVGNNQLSLKVTDTDPERAAAIANVWAHNVAQRLNNLFGSSGSGSTSLQEQAAQSRQDWDEAENALLEYMQQVDFETLKVNLDEEKQAQAALLRKINNTDLLVSDAQALMARLESQNGTNPITLEDALSLISLNQLASGELENFQIQLTGEIISGQDTTVSEARKSLDTLISGLLEQQDQIQTQFDAKTALITSLATRLEEVRYNINLLSVQRDLSQQAYEGLTSHQVEIQILSSGNDQVAKVAGEALPPDEPSSPNSRLNAMIGAGLGLVLSTGIILVWSWWKTTE